MRLAIDATFRARQSVRTLAAAAGVHPDYLSAQFTRAFGASIGEYVRLRRVAWAARALAESEQLPSQIAPAAGFCDQSHLGRCFSEQFGIGPGRFQRGLRSRALLLVHRPARLDDFPPSPHEDLVIARGCAFAPLCPEARVSGRESNRPQHVASRQITLALRAPGARDRVPQGISPLFLVRLVTRVESLDPSAALDEEHDLESGLLHFVDHGRLDPLWRWYIDDGAEETGEREASVVGR